MSTTHIQTLTKQTHQISFSMNQHYNLISSNLCLGLCLLNLNCLLQLLNVSWIFLLLLNLAPPAGEGEEQVGEANQDHNGGEQTTCCLLQIVWVMVRGQEKVPVLEDDHEDDAEEELEWLEEDGSLQVGGRHGRDWPGDQEDVPVACEEHFLHVNLLSLLLLLLVNVMDYFVATHHLSEDVKMGEVVRKAVEDEESEEDDETVPAEEEDAEVDGSHFEDKRGEEEGEPGEEPGDESDLLHDLPLDLLLRVLVVGHLPVGGEAQDLVASFADEEETGNHREDLRHFDLHELNLDEVDLEAQLQDTSEKHLGGVQGQDLRPARLVFPPDEEEKVELLRAALAHLPAQEGAAEVDAGGEEELDKLKRFKTEIFL